MALQKAIDYSAVLDVDEELRPVWTTALKNIAPFRTTIVNGVEVFAQVAASAFCCCIGWPLIRFDRTPTVATVLRSS